MGIWSSAIIFKVFDSKYFNRILPMPQTAIANTKPEINVDIDTLKIDSPPYTIPTIAISVVTMEKKSACFEKNEIIVLLTDILTSSTVCLMEFSFLVSRVPKILYGENNNTDPIPNTTKAIASNVASNRYNR